MSSSNRTTSRGGKGPKGDKSHKSDKADVPGGGGKGSGDGKQLPGGGGGGGDTTNKSNEQKIKQVMETTSRSENQVCLALHECDYDIEQAVNMLLEINQDELWETTVKKKKNRQASTSKSDKQADGGVQGGGGGTGDEWSDAPPHAGGGGGGGEKDKPRNKSTGTQRLHGRHSDNRGWRGREKQENERNLEDGGRDRDRRGRSGGPTRGPGAGRGRGGGRAGGRYPPRGSRGGGFNSRPMETWDNSNNTWDGGNTAAPQPEECWGDEFPGADEWCGTLAETKVFTPSQPPEPIIDSEPKPGTTAMEGASNLSSSVQQSMDMLVQMQAAQNSPVAMGGALNAAQTQYFSQLTQQNNANDLKYGSQPPPVPQQQQQPTPYVNAQQPPPPTYNSTPQYAASQPPSNYASYGSAVQDGVPVQQQQPRKTQRARVPPPSKIPATAVEMPGDLNTNIGFLDLQFGALDVMSDSSSFDGVSDPKYQNSSPMDSSTQVAVMDLNAQAQNSSSMDAYSPPKPNAQSSISSALSQSLSNSDSIPQASEHISSGYSSAAASTQRSANSGVTSNAASSAGGGAGSGLDQLNKQNEPPHPYSSSQASTYSSYQPKSTSYQNQSYSSSSNYSGAQSANNSTYQNAYSTNSSYQSASNAAANNSGSVAGGPGSFPSITQANSYPSNNQAYQQNASQSVYGANAGLNNTTNYSSTTAAQYNSYNANHKLKDGNSGYENSTTAASSVSSTSATTTSSLALTQTTTSATSKSNAALAKNSSSVVSNMPPNPTVMSTQYIMGQMPYFQPPIYSYEDMQLLQQRIPHMTTPFYEMSYQTPATTLRDGSYSLSDGRFTRTDSNASPVPSTQTSTPMLAAQTTGPYFFTPYNPMQPSYQFGVYSQLPTGTNAHGSSNTAQYPKPATYGSGYTSGYESLSQSQDYSKGGYVGNTQGQNKGTGANASSTGNAANDLSMYGKSHTALGKVNSYEKQGFHSGTPPPFTGALGQSALAPSGTGYGPQMYIPTLPHQQHHSTQLIHQPLHQMEVRHQGRRMDSGNSTGQRTQANNQPKTGAKPGYPNSYWNQP